MTRFIHASIVALLMTMTTALQPVEAFMGHQSSEARLSFEAYFEISSRSEPTAKRVKGWIENHLLFLYGPMSLSKYPSAPKGDHQVTSINVEKIADGFRVSYAYSGTIVLAHGPRSTYQLFLPIRMRPAYSAGFVSVDGTRQNLCTDPSYPSEYDYSYFWSPERPGCPLIEGQHYYAITGKIERLPNTTSSAPEYSRLEDENGRIHISLFIGMDDPSNGGDLKTSTDLNAENFLKLRRKLEQLGFKKTETTSEELLSAAIPSQTLSKLRRLPHLEEYAQAYSRGSREIVIRMFFGATGHNESSVPFHYLLKDAVANSAVVLYDGHSGDGAAMRLKQIEERHGFRFHPAQGRYQIYFFNSCSSYTYYNSMFFERKRVAGADPQGTKFLDIVTAGLATDFEGSARSNSSLIQAIHQWAYNGTATGYRTLISRISLNNLAAVNGDEDND